VLKIATYFYDNNTPKDVLCLYGTVATQYRGNRYNIPIQLWLHEDYPMVAPLAYVKPTSDMFISQTSKYVQPDGRIILSYLIEWAYVRLSLFQMSIIFISFSL
jgi:ESCRT-I complex subunit TSG101